MSKTSTDDPVEFLNAMADANGIAVSSVSDGHVFVFTKQRLQQMLEACADKDRLVVFVKKPTNVGS